MPPGSAAGWLRPVGPAWHAAGVDADVSAAVGAVLEAVVTERVAEATRTSAVFGVEAADRVARFTLTGGRRRRSRLLWWAFRGCGGGDRAGGTDRALRVAAALELIQTCALVHDDVMDDAPTRRGRPALHAEFAVLHPGAAGDPPHTAFGTAAAVLAGDLALVWADDVLTTAGTRVALPERVARAWRAMRADMVAGQYLDLRAQATGGRSIARAVRIACLKSALYSVERPLQLGAVLAGADEPTVRRLRLVGRCAGLAFQFHDDLLDAFGDPRQTGKPTGGDLRHGKLTLLLAVGLARARAAGDTEAYRLLADPADRAPDALEVLDARGARAAVEAAVNRLRARVVRALDGVALTAPAGGELRRLLATAAGAPEGWTP
jgi:geranylgeranyl diphosphate synthase, type I